MVTRSVHKSIHDSCIIGFFSPCLIFVSVEELDDFSDSDSDFESTQKGKRWRRRSTAQPPVMYIVLSYKHLSLIYLLR